MEIVSFDIKKKIGTALKVRKLSKRCRFDLNLTPSFAGIQFGNDFQKKMGDRKEARILSLLLQNDGISAFNCSIKCD